MAPPGVVVLDSTKFSLGSLNSFQSSRFNPSNALAVRPLCDVELRGLLRLMPLNFPLKTGGDSTIDFDQVGKMLRSGPRHQRKSLSHDKNAQVQNILSDCDRQLVVVDCVN
jgi:hypothetical protein